DAIGRISISRNVKSLVPVIGPVKVIRNSQLVRGPHVPVKLGQRSAVPDGVLNRQTLVLVAVRFEEVNQCKPLAVRAAVNQRFIGGNRGSRNRTGRTDWLAKIGSRKILEDLLEGPEKEHFVFDYGSADCAAKLLPAEVGQRLSIGRIGGKSFETLEVKQAAVNLVGARFGYDVDNAARSASEFRAGAGRDDLKFLDGIQRDIDGGPLAPGLLSKEAVVIVTAVEADVVEDCTLAGEVYFIAVGSLHYADAGREREQVLEFSS